MWRAVALACVCFWMGAYADDDVPPSAITTHQFTEDVEFAKDGTNVATLHYEIRANNEAGVDGASRRTATYDSAMADLEVVEAHTLKADGKIIPVAPAAIFERHLADDGSVLSGRRQKVILFPQFEAGDTAVYTLKRTVHEVHFPGKIVFGTVFEPTAQADEVRITAKIPASLPVITEAHEVEATKKTADGFNIFTWQYSAHNNKLHEVVPVSPLQRNPRFFLSTFKSYDEIAAAYAAMAAPKIAVTPAIASLANEITKGERSRLKQAQKLYDWVASHIRYVAVEIGSGSMVPHEADAILKNGYGDCKDHDALYEALLKAKDIKANTVLINLGHEYSLTDVPTSMTLNHAITYLPEFDLYVDSTAAVAPFGILPFEEYGKPVLLAGISHAVRGTTPVLKPGVVAMETATDETLNADGTISGTTKMAATGPSAVWLRQRGLAILRARPAQAAANLLTQQGYDHGNGNFRLSSPKTLEAGYEINADFKAEGWSEKLKGKPFSVPDGLTLLASPGDGPMGALRPGQLKDDEPTVCFSEHQAETVSLHVPAGLRVAELPKDVRVETANLSFSAHWSFASGTLAVRREFTSRIDVPVCSGKIREETVTALKKIREHYRTQIHLVPASAS